MFCGMIAGHLCIRGRIFYSFKNVILPRHLSSSPSSSLKYPVNKTKWNLVEPVQSLIQDGNVLVSTSSDIYDNLAIEDWFYQNYDFSHNNERLLLLWTNEPAVVVGRHQNVWNEINMRYCWENGIKIARRNSGGGTVYHDLENLNISFLTSRKNYDRKRNLAFIRDVLKESFGLETEINSREDLIVSESNEKVSGTASKLNAYNSYHHCTLLIDSDRNKLRNSLRREPIPDLVSRATKSVPSPILNLKTLNSTMNVQDVILKLSEAFRTTFTQNEHSQMHEVDRQTLTNIDVNRILFNDWNWIYGKTPSFTISNNLYMNGKEYDLKVAIDKGKIVSIELPEVLKAQAEVVHSTMLGARFVEDDLLAKITELRPRWLSTFGPDCPPVDGQLQFDTFCVAFFNCYNKCNGLHDPR